MIGDTHGDFRYLELLIKQYKAKNVFICGDFGYWPINDKEFMCPFINNNAKIYFCDGNHENHFALGKLLKKYGKKNPIEVCENIYYMPRGSILNLNGKKILFMGGAESMDKHLRIPHFDWFPEESITINQINALKKTKIHTVISHAAPRFVLNDLENMAKRRYITPILLEHVFELYKPKYWYFGHYHQYYSNYIDDCWFYGLNKTGDNGHYKKLQ